MSAHFELSEKYKKIIIEKNTHNDSIFCAIDGHPINNFSDIQFHNIKPVFIGQKDEIYNISVVCKKHHKELGHNSITELKSGVKII